MDGDELAGFAIDDSGYVIVQAATGALDQHLSLLALAEAQLRANDRASIDISVWDSDHPLCAAVRRLGYAASGTFGRELVFDIGEPPREPRLPEGFSMQWLAPELDDSFVELHRAAWSTRAPSTYDRQMHGSVTSMPDFDRELVPIVAAPDGTLAAYCIGWLDRRTQSVEIEPLGTHPQFRRIGLARAIVHEIIKRSARFGARTVMVWGVSAKPEATQLYESAGFRSRRVLREYKREL